MKKIKGYAKSKGAAGKKSGFPFTAKPAVSITKGSKPAKDEKEMEKYVKGRKSRVDAG